MNMKQWIEDLKTSEKKKAMPVLSFPSISLMGITVKELINSSELQAKAMKLVADRVNSLASVSMMDLSVEAEAFGSEITVSDDEVPTVTNALVTNITQAQELKVPPVGTARTGIYINAIKSACELITDRPVFAGVIGPFSLAGRLMDVSEAMINCYIEPDMVHITLDKATQFLIDYINSYKEAGANGIVMAEPLTGMLSPDLAATFSEPYVKRIVDAVQTDDFIVIYHNCGDNTIEMMNSILNTGCSAYHFGNAVKMADVLSLVPSDTVVMGNIDPAGQFRNGTPESIKATTEELLKECSKYNNFIISSGCDIPPLSSWDNIDAFFEAVDNYYSKL